MGTRFSNEVYFGGPDCAPARLRDLLAERVAAVPAGGAIHWVTYYFRDRRLAEELLRARHRGAAVNVTLEGCPRTAHANDAVVRLLAGPDGLGHGFRSVIHGQMPTPPGIVWKPHLHEKLYCFSHPRPVALVGSFNPSGDEPEEDPAVVREIGDQDRGHNALIELRDPRVVDGLVSHARRMHATHHSVLERFSRDANRPLQGENLELHFWPRVRPNPVIRLLRRFGRGTRVRIAASHIKGPASVTALLTLARRGAALEILAEATTRRVSPKVERLLTEAQIPIRRITHPAGLPMHNKFLLIEQARRRWVVFGSWNWTTRSRWLNHEIGAIAQDPKLFDAFAARWEALAAMPG